jgi:D-3-phosphoglycerate dehydrogenase
MSTKNIVLCFPLQEPHIAQIREASKDDFKVIVASQETIGQNIFDADIFCGHAKTPVNWAKVVKQGRLQWIQSSAAGLDHCLVPEVIASPIMVSGCSALFSNPVAETTMALLMGLVRRLPIFFHAQQAREYVRRPTDDLYGKSVAIIGFGGNGQRIAQVLRPMVDRIVASDCFPDACQSHVESGLVDQIFSDTQTDQMLTDADVVIITLPLSKTNEHSFGDRQFAACKRGAYFVNVGRGSVVQQDALVQSLQSGQIGAAGLDVADPEPIEPSSPLWDMDNVIITPHVGAQSSRRIPVTIDLFCENLNRFRNNQTPLNLVDKPLGFPRPEHRVDRSWC